MTGWTLNSRTELKEGDKAPHEGVLLTYEELEKLWAEDTKLYQQIEILQNSLAERNELLALVVQERDVWKSLAYDWKQVMLMEKEDQKNLQLEASIYKYGFWISFGINLGLGAYAAVDILDRFVF